MNNAVNLIIEGSYGKNSIMEALKDICEIINIEEKPRPSYDYKINVIFPNCDGELIARLIRSYNIFVTVVIYINGSDYEKNYSEMKYIDISNRILYYGLRSSVKKIYLEKNKGGSKQCQELAKKQL